MIYTCGHGTRSFEDLVRLLTDNGITLLIDVRASPRSRFNPWFNRKFLEMNLPVKYAFMGDRLGGKNAKDIPPQDFAAAIDEVIASSKEETVCVMCSERLPTPTKWRPEGCHRLSSLTPEFERKGETVEHLV